MSSVQPAWASTTGVRRVMAELRSVQASARSAADGGSSRGQVGEIEVVGDDVNRWRFRISGFDPDLPAGRHLNEDLERHSRASGGREPAALLLEATFPSDYPTSPFFVRVVKPRCRMYTGHVTAGGSICVEALTLSGGPGGWRPSYTFEAVMRMVLFNMLNAEEVRVQTPSGPGGMAGPLRLDPAHLGSSVVYGEAEALAAMARTVVTHGWAGQPRGQPVQAPTPVGPPEGDDDDDDEDYCAEDEDYTDEDDEDDESSAEVIESLVESCMEYVMERDMAVMVEGRAFGGSSDGGCITFTFHDLPPDVAKLYNLDPSDRSIALSLHFKGGGLATLRPPSRRRRRHRHRHRQPRPSPPPRVTMRVPCVEPLSSRTEEDSDDVPAIERRIRREDIGLSDACTSSSTFDRTTMHHVKALLSLIECDLDATWPGMPRKQRLDRVHRRVSSAADAMTSGAFAVASTDASAVVDALAESAAILRHTDREVFRVVERTSERRPDKARSVPYLRRFVEACASSVSGLSARCFLCGCRHGHADASAGAALSSVPGPCTKALCRYSYQSRSMMELLPHVRGRPRVVELLVALAKTAAASARSASLMTPVLPEFAVGSEPDYRAVVEGLDQLPEVAELARCRCQRELVMAFGRAVEQARNAAKDVKEPFFVSSPSPSDVMKEPEDLERPTSCQLLTQGGRLALLLWWVVSNPPDRMEEVPVAEVRAYLACKGNDLGIGDVADGDNAARRMAIRMTVPGMPLMCAKFTEHVRSHGTVVGFHGSPAENWWSILKHGIHSMSGKPMQLHGAAYGSGIYLGHNYKTSAGYSNGVSSAVARRLQSPASCTVAGAGAMTKARTHMHVGTVVAVCEVAKAPGAISVNNSFCMVVPDLQHLSFKYIVIDFHI